MVIFFLNSAFIRYIHGSLKWEKKNNKYTQNVPSEGSFHIASICSYGFGGHTKSAL